MRTTWQPFTTLLALTFLFLFSGSSVVFGGDWEDGLSAFKKQDYKTAHKLWLPLAQKGHASAQNYLGFMYHKGLGVLQDYKEAVTLYRLAAEQGNAPAQNKLGIMYHNGLGVLQDYKKAIRWYRLAAEQGNAPAQNKLGIMYAEGTGVPQDYTLAHMWWNIGASSGHKGCVRNRKKVEKKMTKQQIEEAQRLARNWKPTKK